MRKISTRRMVRDEKGYVLIAALLVLLVLGLISGPLLSYMVNGLTAGHTFEVGAAELYGADGGVQDAVWKIQNNIGLCVGSPTTEYTISDINGRSVDVTVTWMYNTTETVNYRVESAAITPGGDSETRILAYVTGVSKYGDYSGLLGQVLTSQTDITLKPGTEVYPPEGEHSPIEYYEDDWPTLEELIDFYMEDVSGVEPYGSDILIFNGDTDLGPFYRDGDLEIKAGTAGFTLTLTGTIYVTGDTLIGSAGQDFTLDLNGQTVFVESDSADPQKALWIGGKCTVIGSGVIIAVGDMYFEPNTEAGVTDPIFVMSVLGTTSVQPGGDFYGSIAGSVEIQLQPGTSINYPESEDWYGDLNFLIGIQKLEYGIVSYEVSRQ
jgi:hypothetical protein